MLTMILEWLYYICCMVCVVLVGEWTFQWTVWEWKRFVGASIIYALTIASQYMSVNEMIPMFILFFVGEFISWGLVCRGKLREKIFPMLGVYYGVSLLELIVRVMLDLVTKSLMTEKICQLVAIIITCIILAIVTKTNQYKNLVLYFKSISKAKSVIIWILIIIGMLMVTFSMAVQTMLDNEVISMIFRGLMIVELCVVVTIVIWLVMESYQKKYYLEQNNLKEEIIHSQKNYYQTIYEKDLEMRSFRHDIASQLEMFKILLENGEIEKLKEHFERVQRDFNRASFAKIYVGNDVLDAIISMMNQKAQEKGIMLDVVGRIEYTKDYGVYDLCAIFSNAVNNAIEACERINSKGPIFIKLMEHNQTLCCVFQNPATEEMYQNIRKGETGKEDILNHGYGVGNIKRAVERLEGNMEYRYDDGQIILEIYI